MAEITFGLKVTLIGMGVTFIGLIALIGLIYLNKFIADSVNKAVKSKSAEITVDAAKIAQRTIKAQQEMVVEIPTPLCAASRHSANNNSVIAAITAAVSVMMEGTPFKVKSVKRSQAPASTNSWDMVAIQEQNNNL